MQRYIVMVTNRLPDMWPLVLGPYRDLAKAENDAKTYNDLEGRNAKVLGLIEPTKRYEIDA